MRDRVSRQQREGTVSEWNDARGFGFIADPNVRGRIFFHIKDVISGAGRPEVGDRMFYELGKGKDGRPAAQNVHFADAKLVRGSAPMRVTLRIVGALMLMTAIAVAVIAGRAPFWLPVVYLAAGAVSFVAYEMDKRAAEAGAWRTTEATLHGIDLAFGIVGGLLAQGLLRHKSSKPEFGAVSALVFALHLAGLLALIAAVELQLF